MMVAESVRSEYNNSRGSSVSFEPRILIGSPVTKVGIDLSLYDLCGRKHDQQQQQPQQFESESESSDGNEDEDDNCEEDEEQIILQLSQINSWLCVSGFEASEDVQRLKERSINRVFNITPEKKSVSVLAAYKDAGIVEQCFPITDIDSADIISIIQEIAPTIQPSDRVLCQCQAGVSRSISIAIGLMMTLDGLSLDTALEQIKAARHIARPNPGFLEQLQKLQRRYHAD